ncbi:MAG TPA: hypothetical protein VEW48_15000 [Thermoanaerobaculia bacterium]|nr:hypothetical protein [Thermoanaerobaculia bacterium]
MTDFQAEVQRIAEALRNAIRLSGISHRQIERDLGMSTGYLTRILTGQLQLKVTHVLWICEVIDFPAEGFFAALYPARTPASEREARLTRVLAQLHGQTPDQRRDPETLLRELGAFLEEIRTELRERKDRSH